MLRLLPNKSLERTVTDKVPEEKRRRGPLSSDVRGHWIGTRMLHPQQFDVNEAWIAFRLNGAPIRTERDGDFNCVAPMDAASCFVLGSEFVPVAATEPTQAECRRLLKSAHLISNSFLRPCSSHVKTWRSS